MMGWCLHHRWQIYILSFEYIYRFDTFWSNSIYWYLYFSISFDSVIIFTWKLCPQTSLSPKYQQTPNTTSASTSTSPSQTRSNLFPWSTFRSPSQIHQLMRSKFQLKKKLMKPWKFGHKISSLAQMFNLRLITKIIIWTALLLATPNIMLKNQRNYNTNVIKGMNAPEQGILAPIIALPYLTDLIILDKPNLFLKDNVILLNSLKVTADTWNNILNHFIFHW